MTRARPALLTAIVVWAVSGTALAAPTHPTLVVSQVNASHFPHAVLYVTVLSDKGYPVPGLSASDFVVSENGLPVRAFTVTTAVEVDEPLAAVLALDVSGSMQGNALEAEKAAAHRFARALRPQDQMNVFAFATHVRPILEFTYDKSAVMEAITALAAGGSTALHDALQASVDAATRAAPRRRIVVLMTDGRDTGSLTSLEDGLNRAIQEGVPVYTIGLGPDLDRQILNRIAERTGGTSLFAHTPGTLDLSFQAITDQLRSQYVITYESPTPRGMGVHRVTVTANLGGETLQVEKLYEVPELEVRGAVPLEFAERVTVGDRHRLEGVLEAPDHATEGPGAVSSTLPNVKPLGSGFRLSDVVGFPTGQELAAVVSFAQPAPLHGAVGVALVGLTLLLLASRRALLTVRTHFRRLRCRRCEFIYPALEPGCPRCLKQGRATAEERTLGEFLVQNNLLTPDVLETVLHKSRDLGQGLELTALQEGLVSARDLSQARFYLAQSTEMYDRLNSAGPQKHRFWP